MRTTARDDDPTVNDTAREMKTRIGYIYNLRAAGLLDGYIAPDGRWRIRRASLDAYLKRRAARREADQIPAA